MRTFTTLDIPISFRKTYISDRFHCFSCSWLRLVGNCAARNRRKTTSRTVEIAIAWESIFTVLRFFSTIRKKIIPTENFLANIFSATIYSTRQIIHTNTTGSPAGQFVCPQFPYRGNDTIFWIFPIVPCHAFCMWHWPIGKDLDLSFIWGHHHLHLVGLWISVNQLHTSQLATPCWRDPTRSEQLSTVAIWLSVWTLSCHCPVKHST